MNGKLWVGRFYVVLLGLSLAVAASVYYFFTVRLAIFSLLGAGLLAGGFKLTEMLVGVFTKTRGANASAIVIVMGLKLGWWILVFVVARNVSSADSLGLALGFGAFLAAILVQGLWAAGLPKLSAHEKDS